MGQDIIIEFTRIGTAVKVTAMDTRTLTEVSIVGPANAGEATLKRNVLRKLEYVMTKDKDKPKAKERLFDDFA